MEQEQQTAVAQAVAEDGWAVFQVEEDEFSPGFAFSVGLFESYRHPEIMLFGLPSSMMQQIINNVAQRVKEGASFQPGSSYADIFAGYKCAFREVSAERGAGYLEAASAFYGARQFPVLQCVWPDRSQRFPWQEGFDPALAHHQPLLDQ